MGTVTIFIWPIKTSYAIKQTSIDVITVLGGSRIVIVGEKLNCFYIIEARYITLKAEFFLGHILDYT